MVEHALQVHPEIGPGGTPAGPRSGMAYEFLAREAEAAGLPLRWTDRIPYSRPPSMIIDCRSQPVQDTT